MSEARRRGRKSDRLGGMVGRLGGMAVDDAFLWTHQRQGGVAGMA